MGAPETFASPDSPEPPGMAEMDHFLLMEDSSTYPSSKDYAEVAAGTNALQDSTCCPQSLPSPPFLAIRLIILVIYCIPTDEVLALLKEKGAEQLQELAIKYWHISLGVGFESDDLVV